MILVCLILEVALRCTWDRDLTPKTIKTFHKSDYYERVDRDVWRPKPHLKGIHDFFDASFTTNSRGFRGSREYEIHRRAGIKRVLVVGDSFAWGFGVEDEEVFTDLLERKLPGTEVINLGVIGYGLPQTLRYLRDTGIAYHPDVILFALCQNDLSGSCGGSSASANQDELVGPGVQDDPFAQGFLRSLKAGLYRNSYLHAACVDGINSNKTLARFAVRIGLKERLHGFEGLDINLYAAMLNPPPSVSTALDEAKVDLLRLDALAREHGARLLIALIPSLQAVDRDAFARTLAYTQYDPADFDVDKPYRMIERFAQERGISVCTPLGQFRRLHGEGATLFLRKDMHFNPVGHRAFADALEPVLRTILADELAADPEAEGQESNRPDLQVWMQTKRRCRPCAHLPAATLSVTPGFQKVSPRP